MGAIALILYGDPAEIAQEGSTKCNRCTERIVNKQSYSLFSRHVSKHRLDARNVCTAGHRETK